MSKNTAMYGEWAPRFSLGKIFNFYKPNSFFKDLLISLTLEHGNSGVATRAYLYGFGIDLNIPYFTFFKYNFYVRDNPDKIGSTFQSTIVWKANFSILSLKWVFGGFFDYVHGSEGLSEDNTLSESHFSLAPQLLLDASNIFTERKFNILRN